MMPRATERARWRALGVLAGVALVSAAQAAALPRGVHVRGLLGAGFDTNALTFDTGMATSGYLPYETTVSFDRRVAARSDLRLQANLAGNAYSDVAPGGREQAYGASARWIQGVWGERRTRTPTTGLDLVIQPYWRAARSVYTSHRKYREIRRLQRAHDGEPESYISLGGRWDYTDLGAEVGLEWRGPHAMRWDLEYETLARNYKNDYRWVGLENQGVVTNPVQRNDYTLWALRLGTELPLGHGLALRARYWHDRMDWAARASRYIDGFLVLDPSVFETQRWDTDVLRTGLQWEPSRRFRGSVEPAWAWRKDHAWGYWDSALWSIDTEVRIRPRPRMEIVAAYHYAHRDYATARVDFSAPVLGQPLLDDYPRTLVLETSVRVARHGSILARYVHDNVGDANPAFRYERTRALLGYEFRY